jgi:flagellum-specific peptidoglycan hydrolase FlgJ
MNTKQAVWIEQAMEAAANGGHLFPDIAACEAALESNYGESQLAKEGLNFFGMKQHQHPEYGTLSLPTKEFEHGQWTVVQANWVLYPTYASCFQDRMETLGRLSSARNAQGELAYPHYLAALHAATPEDFVKEVSQHWSTDPNRATKVLEIRDAFLAFTSANPGVVAPPAQEEVPATPADSGAGEPAGAGAFSEGESAAERDV